MNHFALFLKLMDRSVAAQVLFVSCCMSCVQCRSASSLFYELKSGLRDKVLCCLHFCFGSFTDDLVMLLNNANIGCGTLSSCTSMFLFLNDIILLTP